MFQTWTNGGSSIGPTEEGIEEGKENFPNLDVSEETREILGQKAALVIRLYYEEERRRAKERMSEGGTIGNDIRWNGSGTPNLERAIKVTGETAEILAKKAGISKTNMYNLLAVYRNRPDLFERVFNGEISINKAYTQMKADEEPAES